MADEFDLKPTSRGEEFLDVILRSLGGDTPDIPQPAWRYEEYLAAIANAIQNGGGGGSSGGGVLVAHVDMQTRTLDKTWKEISDAPFAVLRFPHPEMGGTAIAYNTITYIISGSTYEVRFNDPSYGVTKFVADSENGYPVYAE